MELRIAPSILAADLWSLGEAVEQAEAGGAAWMHVDVMDGHFVPNLTFGPCIVKSLKKHTRLPLDVHLMITDAPEYVERFADAGADIITFHIEAVAEPPKIIERIRAKGCRVGVTLNPPTPVPALDGVLDAVDMVLVMTVNPGFSYQKMIPECVEKVRVLRERMGPDFDIEVDGGVNKETIPLVARAGANIVVAGGGVFAQPDIGAATRELLELLTAESRLIP